MAFDYSAAGDVFSGLGNAFGSFAESAGSTNAAKFYDKAAAFSKTEGELKDIMLRRQAFQTIGGTQADVAGAGLKMSGSALDVLKSNAQQAAVSKSIVDVNTQIEEQSYSAQAAAARAAAKAQEGQGIGQLLGAGMSLLGAFSDDRLKENIELISRRGDGVGIYHFNYIADPSTRFEGVLASEIERLYPGAVFYDLSGYRKVDYGYIGVEMRKV